MFDGLTMGDAVVPALVEPPVCVTGSAFVLVPVAQAEAPGMVRIIDVTSVTAMLCVSIECL